MLKEDLMVQKRDGRFEVFNLEKVKVAIASANNEVPKGYTIFKGDINGLADLVEYEICNSHSDVINIEVIQNTVEFILMSEGYYEVAKKFIVYRHDRELARKFKERDDSVLALINGTNDELKTENSNKNPTLASTQRDYIAGEVCKDLAKRVLLPKDVTQAHKDGAIHFHDMDYSPVQKIFNCCLINIKDMLDNGTCINGTMVESPSTFTTACTVTTQIIASVASSQFGGQSVNIKHLGKYLKRSHDKYLKMFNDEYLADKLMFKDLKDGVQTIQYQINTISCTDG